MTLSPRLSSSLSRELATALSGVASTDSVEHSWALLKSLIGAETTKVIDYFATYDANVAGSGVTLASGEVQSWAGLENTLTVSALSSGQRPAWVIESDGKPSIRVDIATATRPLQGNGLGNLMVNGQSMTVYVVGVQDAPMAGSQRVVELSDGTTSRGCLLITVASDSSVQAFAGTTNATSTGANAIAIGAPFLISHQGAASGQTLNVAPSGASGTAAVSTTNGNVTTITFGSNRTVNGNRWVGRYRAVLLCREPFTAPVHAAVTDALRAQWSI